MTSRIATYCFLASLTPAVVAGQSAMGSERLTLEAAVRMAIENNRQLQSARLEVQKADADVASARTRRLPVFDIDVSTSQLLMPVEFGFPRGAFGEFPGVGPIPAVDTTLSVSSAFRLGKAVVNGRSERADSRRGSKVAAHWHAEVEAGGAFTVEIRLSPEAKARPFAGFAETFTKRLQEPMNSMRRRTRRHRADARQVGVPLVRVLGSCLPSGRHGGNRSGVCQATDAAAHAAADAAPIRHHSRLVGLQRRQSADPGLGGLADLSPRAAPDG